MIPYLLILSIMGCAATLSLVMPKRLRWFLVGMPTLLLLCFMGFRERVGADWIEYVGIFREYYLHSFAQARANWGIELGYALLNLVVGRLTGNFHVLLFLCAGMLLWGILRLAREFNLDPTLTLFLSFPYLIIAVGMGYERQSAALGLSLVALCELKAGRMRRFFLYAALATSMHYSAGPFLLIFWVDSWWRAILVTALAGGSIFLSALNDTVQKINGYVGGSLAAAGVWFRLAILLLGFAVIWLQRDRWREDARAFSFLKRSAVVILLFVPFAQWQSVIIDRFSLYFFFAYLLGMGKAMEFAPANRRWLVFGLLNVQAFAILVFWFSISFFARYYWVPYGVSTY